MIRAVKKRCFAIPLSLFQSACQTSCCHAAGLIALTPVVILLGFWGTAGAITTRAAVQFQSCPGWGLCVFRRVDAEATGSAAHSVSSATLRVRLRGVGDPALAGVCPQEGDAARTVRHFVEGILMRAGRIELDAVEPGTDGSVVATVRVDGTDVADIVAHLGLGRERALAPGATWCE